MFFLTNAEAGKNVYGCGALNTWTLQSGGGSALTITSSGTAVGSRTTLDLSGGNGVLFSSADTGTAIAVQAASDTSYLQTLAGAQRGTALSCRSTTGNNTTYSCAMSPTLGIYATGMQLYWSPDVTASSGGITLEIDSLGPRAVKLSDGVSNPSLILAGHTYPVWYDGAQFRLAENQGMQPLAQRWANMQTGTASVAQNGADATLYTAANVPALGQGSCYQIFFGTADTTTGLTLKLFVDSTQIASIAASGGQPAQGNILYCNSPGTQSAQGLAYVTPTFTGNALAGYGSSAVSVPQAVDWSIPHTLQLKSNASTGTVSGLGFAIY
jgi:hypothetical protein